MQTNKNYWLAACGTLAVASAIMLFSAHRIEAQYSSPVKVLNTSAGPVLNSRIDDPGRIPYQSNLFNAGGCAGSTICTLSFGPVPANHRLVVQHVSGSFAFSGNGGGPLIDLTSPGLTAIIQFISPATPGGFGAFDVPVQVYYDAGSAPVVEAFLFGSQLFTGQEAFATLTGYMLDCSAAPCAAIAH
jgi:hypothetical protein